MASGRLFIIAALALAASGCAARGTRAHLARLQSQVGLLDDRVSQLERVGTVSAAFNTDSAAAEGNWASGADSASSQEGPSRHKPSAAARSSKKSRKLASDKPSTREIQHALKSAGFYQGELDGKMGPLTRQAVEEFQRINGLKADGVVGTQTWSKLKQYADLSGSDATTYTK